MVEMQGHTSDLGRKLRSTLIGTVGDNHASHSPGLKTSGRTFADLTGSKDHDTTIFQGSENLPRKLHRHRTDGGWTAGDLGLRANRLGDTKSVLKELMERSSCGSGIRGRRVGLLDLPKDLGFSNHHRVEAAGHPEEMPHRLRRDMMVKRGLESGSLGEDRTESIQRPQGAEAGGVEFHTVARGKHDSSGDSLDGTQPAKQLLHLALAHGKPLAQVKMCGAVIQACAEDIHCDVCGGA